MRQMMRAAEKAVAQGRPILIFPEGTRSAPGAAARYHPGVAGLYRRLNLPVVPVALNSGLFWERNSVLLWPGTARARFLPPIPPGLPPEEFQARLTEAIEGETDRLLLDAYRQGLSRPIGPELRERLDALAERASPTAPDTIS